MGLLSSIRKVVQKVATKAITSNTAKHPQLTSYAKAGGASGVKKAAAVIKKVTPKVTSYAPAKAPSYSTSNTSKTIAAIKKTATPSKSNSNSNKNSSNSNSNSNKSNSNSNKNSSSNNSNKSSNPPAGFIGPTQPAPFGGIIGAAKVDPTQVYGQKSPYEYFSNGINYGNDYPVAAGSAINLPQGNWKVIQSYNGAAPNSGGERNGTNSGYGNSVLVQNLTTGEQLRFSHLNSVNVQQGQTINGGLIGHSGFTGNATGPHLDVEYYKKAGQQASDLLSSSYAQQLFGSGGTPTNNQASSQQGGNASSFGTTPNQPQIQQNIPQVKQSQPGPLQSVVNYLGNKVGKAVNGYDSTPGASNFLGINIPEMGYGYGNQTGPMGPGSPSYNMITNPSGADSSTNQNLPGSAQSFPGGATTDTSASGGSNTSPLDSMQMGVNMANAANKASAAASPVSNSSPWDQGPSVPDYATPPEPNSDYLNTDYNNTLSAIDAQQKLAQTELPLQVNSLNQQKADVTTGLQGQQASQLQDIGNTEQNQQGATQGALEQLRQLYQEAGQRQTGQLAAAGISRSSAAEAMSSLLGRDMAQRVAGTVQSGAQVLSNLATERTKVNQYYGQQLSDVERETADKITEANAQFQAQLAQLQQLRGQAAVAKQQAKAQLFQQYQQQVYQVQQANYQAKLALAQFKNDLYAKIDMAKQYSNSFGNQKVVTPPPTTGAFQNTGV